MNITFMIGNGFDLNLGLKTSYKNFYEYYIENSDEDIISKSIKDNYELWADLELGLGEILKDVKESEIEEFFDSKANLERLLTTYLTKQNKRFYIDVEDTFSEEFREKIVNFFLEFPFEDKEQYKSVIANANETVFYQFITFNYTNVLDQMIKLVNKKIKPFSTHTFRSTSYTDKLCLPHHIHGTLDGEDLILCVDNPSQIANEAFQSNRKITDYMIKTNVNKALGERKTEIAKEIIDKSKYICLFGLSIGDTDCTWWKYLVEWLNRSESNRLILFVRDDSKVQRSGGETIRFRDKKREDFGDKSCTGGDLYDKISNKIIVVRNSDIFTYESTSTEDEDNGQAEDAQC